MRDFEYYFSLVKEATVKRFGSNISSDEETGFVVSKENSAWFRTVAHSPYYPEIEIWVGDDSDNFGYSWLPAIKAEDTIQKELEDMLDTLLTEHLVVQHYFLGPIKIGGSLSPQEFSMNKFWPKRWLGTSYKNLPFVSARKIKTYKPYNH